MFNIVINISSYSYIKKSNIIRGFSLLILIGRSRVSKAITSITIFKIGFLSIELILVTFSISIFLK